MTLDVGNPYPGLGQAQRYGMVKPVNGIPNPFPLNNWISNYNPYLKTYTDSLPLKQTIYYHVTI